MVGILSGFLNLRSLTLTLGPGNTYPLAKSLNARRCPCSAGGKRRQ